MLFGEQMLFIFLRKTVVFSIIRANQIKYFNYKRRRSILVQIISKCNCQHFFIDGQRWLKGHLPKLLVLPIYARFIFVLYQQYTPELPPQVFVQCSFYTLSLPSKLALILYSTCIPARLKWLHLKSGLVGSYLASGRFLSASLRYTFWFKM